MLLNNNVSLTINGGTVHGDEYGIYTYGRGITNGDVTTVNNEQVTLTITGGRVECGNGGAPLVRMHLVVNTLAIPSQ